MRISDWSSDVCSSDLLRLAGGPVGHAQRDREGSRSQLVEPQRRRSPIGVAGIERHARLARGPVGRRRDIEIDVEGPVLALPEDRIAVLGVAFHPRTDTAPESVVVGRSEEHTSELQSLMRISYAVFCLKKKKH